MPLCSVPSTHLSSCLICPHAPLAPKPFSSVPHRLGCYPRLTAVAFIRLVVAVCVTITAPACVDAQATVTHEFPSAAGLVGSWGNKDLLSLSSLCTQCLMVEQKVPSPAPPNTPAPPQRDLGIQTLLPEAPAPAGTCALPSGGAPPGWLPLLPAGRSTHSSQTRPTSLRSHHLRHSGRCRGCSGHRHTGTPPDCKEERELLRLKGRAVLRPR